MIESPLLDEFAEYVRVQSVQKDIIRFLTARIGAVPTEVTSALQAMTDLKRLDELVDWAGRCNDVEAFRAHLAAGDPSSSC